jgi:hypothetical protein
MKTIILTLVSLFFSSCMHLGMMGMAGHDEGEGGKTQSTLEKELTVENVRVNAFFPVMEKGKETFFTLKLADTSTQQGLGSAEVYGRVDYRARHSSHTMMQGTTMNGRTDTTEEMDHMHMMQHGPDSSMQSDDHKGMMTEQAESDRDGTKRLEESEGKARGNYTFSATASDEGEYTVSFHVVSIGGQRLAPEILVEATRTVSDGSTHVQGGMMGMGSSSTYMIIGAVLMGTMMVVAWFVRGGVHW